MSLGRYDGASFHSPDWASRYRPGDTVMLRIDLGPPSVWTSLTQTAMHGAAYQNWPKLIDFLAANGADISVWNHKNAWGWTPNRA